MDNCVEFFYVLKEVKSNEYLDPEGYTDALKYADIHLYLDRAKDCRSTLDFPEEFEIRRIRVITELLD